MSDSDVVNFKEIEGQIENLIEQGQHPQALKLAKELVDDQPDNPEAYFLRGMAKSYWNQLEEAAEDFKRAIEIEPGEGRYYFMLGCVYLDLDNNKGALSEFERAVHINPDNLDYITSVSRAKANLGDVEGALSDVEPLYRTHGDSEMVKNNLAEIYFEASYKNWYQNADDDGLYALEYDHVRNAQDYADKIKALPSPNEDIKSRIGLLEDNIKIATKRQFTGGWGTLLVAFIFANIMFSAGGTFGYLFCISALVYYFALRTPQYVINKQVFSGEDGKSIGDRIASIFVADGMIVFGRSTWDLYMNMLKTNLLMTVIRSAVRLLLLPITVAFALFKNYSKYHALSFLGCMAGFIVAMNLADSLQQMSMDSSRDAMAEAVENSDTAGLLEQINEYPSVYDDNGAALMTAAIQAGNVEMVDYMITKTANPLKRNPHRMLDEAINANQSPVISYIATSLFQESRSAISDVMAKNGPYSGNYTAANQRVPLYLTITSVNGDNFTGKIVYPSNRMTGASKSAIAVKGDIIGNRINFSDANVLSGSPKSTDCSYTLRLQGPHFVGQRACAGTQAQTVQIKIDAQAVEPV